MLNQSALLAAGKILTEEFEGDDIVKVTLEYLNWLKAQGDTIIYISKDVYFNPSDYGFEYEVIIAYSRVGDPVTGRL